MKMLLMVGAYKNIHTHFLIESCSKNVSPRLNIQGIWITLLTAAMLVIKINQSFGSISPPTTSHIFLLNVLPNDCSLLCEAIWCHSWILFNCFLRNMSWNYYLSVYDTRGTVNEESEGGWRVSWFVHLWLRLA